MWRNWDFGFLFGGLYLSPIWTGPVKSPHWKSSQWGWKEVVMIFQICVVLVLLSSQIELSLVCRISHRQTDALQRWTVGDLPHVKWIGPTGPIQPYSRHVGLSFCLSVCAIGCSFVKIVAPPPLTKFLLNILGPPEKEEDTKFYFLDPSPNKIRLFLSSQY